MNNNKLVIYIFIASSLLFSSCGTEYHISKTNTLYSIVFPKKNIYLGQKVTEIEHFFNELNFIDIAGCHEFYMAYDTLKINNNKLIVNNSFYFFHDQLFEHSYEINYDSLLVDSLYIKLIKAIEFPNQDKRAGNYSYKDSIISLFIDKNYLGRNQITVMFRMTKDPCITSSDTTPADLAF